MLKVGTTFSGIGAPEQALKNLNIPHIVKWACDIDNHAKKVYLDNHTCEVFYDDIVNIDLVTLDYVDLYCFGFPCQDISNVGQQDLSKGRSLLVNYSLDIIDKILPKYILFENVKALTQKKFADFFNEILSRLSINYNVSYKVLNTSNYGLPQSRDRVYGVGICKDIRQQFEFPEPIPLAKKIKDVLDNDVPNEYYYICPSMMRAIDKGKCKILDGEGVSYTITTKQERSPNSGFIRDDKGLRYLTPNECRKLQGFPDNWIFHTSKHSNYKQFGNTISVNVLEAIFRSLLIEYMV